jgi:hypothetical protein
MDGASDADAADDPDDPNDPNDADGTEYARGAEDAEGAGGADGAGSAPRPSAGGGSYLTDADTMAGRRVCDCRAVFSMRRIRKVCDSNSR